VNTFGSAFATAGFAVAASALLELSVAARPTVTTPFED
jgi:hypothetical protein